MGMKNTTTTSAQLHSTATYFLAMAMSVAPRITKHSLAARGRSLTGMSNSRISFHSALSGAAPRDVHTMGQSGSLP